MKSIIAALRRSESNRRAVIARLTRRLRKYTARPTTAQIPPTIAPAPRPRRARLQLAFPAWVGLFFLKGW